MLYESGTFRCIQSNWAIVHSNGSRKITYTYKIQHNLFIHGMLFMEMVYLNAVCLIKIIRFMFKVLINMEMLMSYVK